MCGRLNIHDHPGIQAFMVSLGLPVYPERPPRYNITPTSNVDVLYTEQRSAKIESMQWGIEFGEFRHPNTKTETLLRKPHLRKLLADNRCLVPVNRFYEWPDPKIRPKYQGIKTRFCIHPPEDVMFLGGFYKISGTGSVQFNILTTEPSPAIAEFHHRMPVIVPPNQVTTWLTTEHEHLLHAMLVPFLEPLIIYECHAYVNNGRHDGPQCMEPLNSMVN